MSVASSDPPGRPVTTAVTLVSASGKRMHPRVDLPLKISFPDGQCREADNWSIAGFSLPDAGFAAPQGSIHHVELHVGLDSCTVSIGADAKVIRVSGGFARGFRFIDLSPDKARIIDHFIQSGVDGDAAVIGGLPVVHAGAAGQPPRRRDAVMRNAAQALKLLLLGGTVAAGAAYVLARFLTVTTDYAAVAADLQQLHAPEAGYLLSTNLTVGRHLRAGQQIGTIQPVASPQAKLSTESQIASLQTALEQQKAALEQARAGFATFQQSSRSDLDEAVASRRALEDQITAETRVYQRLTTLQSRDVVAQARLDQEQQTLLTLQRQLSLARSLEEAMRQKLANAEAGRFSSDGRSTQKSPADLEQDIQATQATITRLKTMLAGLEDPLPVVSPCDCVVTALTSTPGAYVLSGAAIADLAQAGAGTATTIDALVQNPRLNLVRQGQATTVYLADRTEGLAGHVVSVNFNPSNTGRTGLPTALRTLDDYGLMTVQLDAPLAGLRVGLPASVMAPVTWAAMAASLPGVRWGQSLMADAVDGMRHLLGGTPAVAATGPAQAANRPSGADAS